MDFSLSPLGVDNDYNSSRKYPILIGFVEMSSRIFYNILKVKIASYYWLSLNKVQRHGHVDAQASGGDLRGDQGHRRGALSNPGKDSIWEESHHPRLRSVMRAHRARRRRKNTWTRRIFHRRLSSYRRQKASASSSLAATATGQRR